MCCSGQSTLQQAGVGAPKRLSPGRCRQAARTLVGMGDDASWDTRTRRELTGGWPWLLGLFRQRNSRRLEVGAPNGFTVAGGRLSGHQFGLPAPDTCLGTSAAGVVQGAEQLWQAGGCCPEPHCFTRGCWRQAARTLVGITSPRRLSGCLCHGLSAVAGGIAFGWRMLGFCHACHASLQESSNR